jgi:hypothetical protein
MRRLNAVRAFTLMIINGLRPIVNPVMVGHPSATARRVTQENGDDSGAEPFIQRSSAHRDRQAECEAWDALRVDMVE